MAAGAQAPRVPRFHVPAEPQSRLRQPWLPEGLLKYTFLSVDYSRKYRGCGLLGGSMNFMA